jgi:hypothetical protein
VDAVADECPAFLHVGECVIPTPCRLDATTKSQPLWLYVRRLGYSPLLMTTGGSACNPWHSTNPRAAISATVIRPKITFLMPAV